MINFIRSCVFYMVFLSFTVLYIPVFIFGGYIIRSDLFARCILRTWMDGFIVLAQKILKIQYTTINFDLVRKTTSPIIVAPKHQSMWEVFLIGAELGENMRAVMKKEIMRYPLLSRLFKNTKGILIDHKQTLKSLKRLIIEGSDAVNAGRNLCIFPEGERVKAGETGKYHGGLYFVYKKLNLPVATIALDAGVYWPTKKFIKKPGHITLKVTGIIDPGLTKEEFDKKIYELIEKPSLELLRSKA